MRKNTVAHWVLYTLNDWEGSYEEEFEGVPVTRIEGATSRDVFEHAGGEDTIVFRDFQEVSKMLSELYRERNLLERRSEGTDWDGPDVIYRYRLNEPGRETLVDLGVPDQLPNRRSEDYDRSLGVEIDGPIQWWASEVSGVGPDEWIETDHPRIYYAEAADRFDRGEFKVAKKLAEGFPDVTFVITMGPYRGHDLSYLVVDPYEPTVQLDFYSPMFQPTTESPDWKELVEHVAYELHDYFND